MGKLYREISSLRLKRKCKLVWSEGYVSLKARPMLLNSKSAWSEILYEWSGLDATSGMMILYSSQGLILDLPLYCYRTLCKNVLAPHVFTFNALIDKQV